MWANGFSIRISLIYKVEKNLITTERSDTSTSKARITITNYYQAKRHLNEQSENNNYKLLPSKATPQRAKRE